MIAVEMLIEVLTERFGTISTNLPKQLKSIDSRKSLKILLRQAIKVKNLNEFEDRVVEIMN